MNERIRELLLKAGFHPELNWDHTDWHAAGHSDLFEKFAELIVRECLHIVDDEGAGEGGCIRAMIRIQKEFGVEE